MYFEIKNDIVKILKNSLEKLNIELPNEIKLDFPPNPELGDLSSTIAFDLAKKLKKSPVEIAKIIFNEIELFGFLKQAKAVGPYINFFIDYNKFSIELLKFIDLDYGKLKNKNTKIVLEHTSANPNGPLHIGHIRNALLGDSLKRVLSKGGYDVETQYYVNDMGRQIAIIVFGLTKLRLKLEDMDEDKIDHKVGKLYYLANKEVDDNSNNLDEVSNLIKIYEAGSDEKLNKIFIDAVDNCLTGVKETLNNINIKHDSFVWEGQFIRDGSVDKVINDLIDTGYTKEKEVLCLDLLDDYGIEKDLVLRRSDGTSLYSTRDLAYHTYKSNIGDKIIDVLGSDHKLAVSQISIALELLKEKVPEVVFYEFINLPQGSMSTRKGVFISVDDLINEAILRAKDELNKRRNDLSEEKIDSISNNIGIGAIRYYIAKISPEKHITFKWDEALNFERGCASIQYAYARGYNLLSKSDKFNIKEDNLSISIDDIKEWNLNKVEANLIRTIAKFPLIVEESSKTLKVHQIAQYSLELSIAFNKFYKSEQVLNHKYENQRLLLVEKAIFVIKESLDLLGVDSPKSM